MKRASVRDLKNHCSALLEWVAEGEEVVITKHGKSIARLVPELSRCRCRNSAACTRYLMAIAYTMFCSSPQHLNLGATDFLTFDPLQAKLAAAEGLAVNALDESTFS